MSASTRRYVGLLVMFAVAIFIASLVSMTLWLGSDTTEKRDEDTAPKPTSWGMKTRERHNLGKDSNSILVTGAAGFIGYSLANTLVEGGSKVIGIDNFNDYYDVELKAERAMLLVQAGVDMRVLDVCEVNQLRHLIVSENITHVLHMAGQAGVRYSLKNPKRYARDNIECFATLLDVLTEFSSIKLVYASSSSVLGSANLKPVEDIYPGAKPQSVYAATKRSNEIIAGLFHRQYGMKTIGLRFFTVYGPWGRPDMAVLDFASKIYAGEELAVYDFQGLARDFTYIDDIVSGVISAMKSQISFGVYNIGSASPEKVSTLISLLEEELGKSAQIRKIPISHSEVTKSWADISAAKRDFEFQPKVSLSEGIKRTVRWWLTYRRSQQEQLQRRSEFEKLAKQGQHFDEEEMFSPSMQLVHELQRKFEVQTTGFCLDPTF